MKQLLQVVMLPTDKESNIYKSPQDTLINKEQYKKISIKTNYESQHLYLVSNEEIKEGNWCIDLDTNKVFQLGNWKTNRAKKIIATTNSSLFIRNKDKFSMKGLIFIPQIPESFLPIYIKAFNEGKPITEVLVEYKEYSGTMTKKYSNEYIWINNKPCKLKLSADNTVIITIPEEKKYTREDMLQMYQLRRTDAIESSYQRKMINNSKQNL